MTITTRAALVLATLLNGATAFGQGLPTVSPPESVGMSSDRLLRLTTYMQQAVQERRTAGTVTLVLRDGRVAYFEAAGKLDVERGAPMTKDAIFRIASMSKAITSVGIMMLVEEGHVALTDPVSRFIPAFAKTKVLSAENGVASVVPARRPITIRDLLTHTAGISYGADDALEAQYKAAGFTTWYFADRKEPIGMWIERLAALPFAAQPGERWVYGYASDVLGHVIERVSGSTLAEFIDRRIVKPLKMVDTSFFLPPEKEHRLAAVYAIDEDGVLTRAADGHPGQGAYVRGARTAFAGGAGLLSTAADYARFLQMLLHGGELEGVRLLSPKTVDLMTSNHVRDRYRNGDLGFGLGFEVVEHLGRAARYGSEGEYSWGGAYHTRYWVDPAERLVTVFMTQLLPAGTVDLNNRVRTLVDQAIVGPPRPTHADRK